ncbi:MAG: hypothetical protein ACTHNU_09305 [Gaiellales bacterium]
MEGCATPDEAAMSDFPAGITHVVECLMGERGESAYVLLAIEARPPGFYLDATICYRHEDGSWWPGDSAGGPPTGRSLEDLRANPPPIMIHSEDSPRVRRPRNWRP